MSSALYLFNPQWAARAFLEHERLIGAAADSPLATQCGWPDQSTFGGGATYAFNMPPLW